MDQRHPDEMIERALALIPKRRASPRPAQAMLKNGALAAWDKACASIASQGLEDVDPAGATLLLADLMPHPQHSHARDCRDPRNVQWAARAAKDALEIAASFESSAWANPESSCSPYPPRFASARIAALGRLGADARVANALARAVFRKSLDELDAVLLLPTCPSPGETTNGHGSALHRACYDSPAEVFELLARRCGPKDWIAQDAQGRVPLEKAYQARKFQRAQAILALTPLASVLPDGEGNTPLHRLAASMGPINNIGRFDPMDRAWAAAIDMYAKAFGPAIFVALNAQGQTPFDVAGHGPVAQALAEKFADSERESLGSAAPGEASPRAKSSMRM